MRARICTSSLLAIGVALVSAKSYAQVAPAQPEQAPTPVAAPPATPQKIGAAPGGSGDIVVTAQRRAEQLINVPATVNVTSSKTLAASNINNSLELGQLVPAVQIITLGNYSEPAIRGITTQVVGVGNPPNVALYVDGIYIAAQDAYNFDFVGIDDIQTLKGPQGTLYGRNATGGAILVTTKKPSFDFGGNASLSYGNLNARSAKVYVTGPISDKIAFNFAGLYRADDGYLHNITTGHDVGKNRTESVRGKILLKPSDTVEIQIGVDHTYFNNPIGYDSSTMNGNSIALQTPGLVIATKPYQVSLNFDPIQYNKQTGGFIRADVDFEHMHLTSLTGLRHVSEFEVSDSDYSPAPLTKNQRNAYETTFSQELDLASTGTGPISWVTGAEFDTDNARNDPVIANDKFNVRNKVIGHAASVFGELTWHITDKLIAVGGIRYSYEHKELNGISAAPPTSVHDGFGSHAWTPRASLRYSPTDNVSVYATYTKGFKSGGYNTNNTNSTNSKGEVVPFKPEKVDAYEVGVKTRFSSAISLDVAGYYYNYKNEQVTAAITTAGVAGTQVLNAASARIYGAEAELRVRPFQGLSAQIGLAYTHDRYRDFPNALLTMPRPGGGNIQFTGDASGFRLVRIPDFTASIAAQYEHTIGNAGTLYLSGNAFISTGFYQSFNNRLHQPSYTVVNGQLGYSPPNAPYRISVFAKNITNKIYNLMMSDSPTGDRLIYAPPRTYGVIFDINF